MLLLNKCPGSHFSWSSCPRALIIFEPHFEYMHVKCIFISLYFRTPNMYHIINSPITCQKCDRNSALSKNNNCILIFLPLNGFIGSVSYN